jgi:hypothetical protein
MNYLVAVMEDRLRAEQAHAALVAANLPVNSLAILGRGFQSADDYGLIDPNPPAWRQVRLMLLWLVPFGFAAGVLFNVITGLDTFSWTGRLGNQVMGGLLGTMAGAMGAFFMGGGASLVIAGDPNPPYHQRLDQGQFLVVVRGSEAMVRQASPVLRQLRPIAMQDYQG